MSLKTKAKTSYEIYYETEKLYNINTKKTREQLDRETEHEWVLLADAEAEIEDRDLTIQRCDTVIAQREAEIQQLKERIQKLLDIQLEDAHIKCNLLSENDELKEKVEAAKTILKEQEYNFMLTDYQILQKLREVLAGETGIVDNKNTEGETE